MEDSKLSSDATELFMKRPTLVVKAFKRLVEHFMNGVAAFMSVMDAFKPLADRFMNGVAAFMSFMEAFKRPADRFMNGVAALVSFMDAFKRLADRFTRGSASGRLVTEASMRRVAGGKSFATGFRGLADAVAGFAAASVNLVDAIAGVADRVTRSTEVPKRGAEGLESFAEGSMKLAAGLNRFARRGTSELEVSKPFLAASTNGATESVKSVEPLRSGRESSTPSLDRS
jgi:hypothetical protein